MNKFWNFIVRSPRIRWSNMKCYCTGTENMVVWNEWSGFNVYDLCVLSLLNFHSCSVNNSIISSSNFSLLGRLSKCHTAKKIEDRVEETEWDRGNRCRWKKRSMCRCANTTPEQHSSPNTELTIFEMVRSEFQRQWRCTGANAIATAATPVPALSSRSKLKCIHAHTHILLSWSAIVLISRSQSKFTMPEQGNNERLGCSGYVVFDQVACELFACWNANQ